VAEKLDRTDAGSSTCTISFARVHDRLVNLHSTFSPERAEVRGDGGEGRSPARVTFFHISENYFPAIRNNLHIKTDIIFPKAVRPESGMIYDEHEGTKRPSPSVFRLPPICGVPLYKSNFLRLSTFTL
jgi:hypothetical protein